MLLCICSVIDHRWCQNVVRTTKKNGRRSAYGWVCHWCSYNISPFLWSIKTETNKEWMMSKEPSKRDNNLTFYINLNASRREINCRPNDPTLALYQDSFSMTMFGDWNRVYLEKSLWQWLVTSLASWRHHTGDACFKVSTCFLAPSGKTWLSRIPEHLGRFMYFNFREVYNV